MRLPGQHTCRQAGPPGSALSRRCQPCFQAAKLGAGFSGRAVGAQLLSTTGAAVPKSPSLRAPPRALRQADHTETFRGIWTTLRFSGRRPQARPCVEWASHSGDSEDIFSWTQRVSWRLVQRLCVTPPVPMRDPPDVFLAISLSPGKTGLLSHREKQTLPSVRELWAVGMQRAVMGRPVHAII